MNLVTRVIFIILVLSIIASIDTQVSHGISTKGWKEILSEIAKGVPIRVIEETIGISAQEFPEWVKESLNQTRPHHLPYCDSLQPNPNFNTTSYEDRNNDETIGDPQPAKKAQPAKTGPNSNNRGQPQYAC